MSARRFRPIWQPISQSLPSGRRKGGRPLVVAGLQQDPSVWGFFARQLPGLVVGTFLGVGGTLLVDRIRAGRQRQQDARALVSAAKAPLNRLNTGLERFDRARRENPEALSRYFSSLDAVFTDQDDRALYEAVSGRNALPIECLEAWTDALEEARRTSELHDSKRSLVGRSNADEQLSQAAGGYRDQLKDAIGEFYTALEHTAEHSTDETEQAIRRLTRD